MKSKAEILERKYKKDIFPRSDISKLVAFSESTKDSRHRRTTKAEDRQKDKTLWKLLGVGALVATAAVLAGKNLVDDGRESISQEPKIVKVEAPFFYNSMIDSKGHLVWFVDKAPKGGLKVLEDPVSGGYKSLAGNPIRLPEP